MMRREGHVGHLQKMRNVYKIKAGKSEGKRPLGRLQYVEKLILKWSDQIQLVQERVQWQPFLNMMMDF
jgi:hypothetical protein